MTDERIKEIRESIAAENISYGEIAEIDAAAVEYGIVLHEELTTDALLDHIEEEKHRVHIIRTNSEGIFDKRLMPFVTDRELLLVANYRGKIDAMRQNALARYKRSQDAAGA